MKKLYCFFCAVFVLCFSIFTSTTIRAYDDDFVDFGSRITIKDKLKSWTIRFKSDVDYRTINSSNIKIVDDKGVEVPAEINLSYDERYVTLTPRAEYLPGKVYKIYVSNNVKSKTNKNMIKGKKLEFILDNINVNPNVNPNKYINILSISDVNNVYFSTLLISASPTVFMINVNGIEAKYLGNNQYTTSSPDFTTGSNVVVQVYDKYDKLIETINYTLEK